MKAVDVNMFRGTTKKEKIFTVTEGLSLLC